MGANNVLGETFWAKRFGRNVLGESFGQFFLEPHFESGAGRWAGLWAGLGGWAGLGLGLLPETEIGPFDNEAEIGLFENGKVCLPRKNELSHSLQQQAISIYFFLEGLGFGV